MDHARWRATRRTPTTGCYFDRIDGHLGDLTERKALVAAAPARGIAVLTYALFGLDDLDQDQPLVGKALLAHLRWLVTSTGADGLRIDTVKHVPVTF